MWIHTHMYIYIYTYMYIYIIYTFIIIYIYVCFLFLHVISFIQLFFVVYTYTHMCIYIYHPFPVAMPVCTSCGFHLSLLCSALADPRGQPWPGPRKGQARKPDETFMKFLRSNVCEKTSKDSDDMFMPKVVTSQTGLRLRWRHRWCGPTKITVGTTSNTPRSWSPSRGQLKPKFLPVTHGRQDHPRPVLMMEFSRWKGTWMKHTVEKVWFFMATHFFLKMALWFLYVFVLTLCFQRRAQGAK